MLKVLSTLWLSFALATVPLQGLTAAVAIADVDPCHHHTHTVDGDNLMADEDCPNCDNQNCNSEGCNHQGCAPVHIQLAKLTQSYNFPVMQPAAPALLTAADHSSRNTPPLLRPPA